MARAAVVAALLACPLAGGAASAAGKAVGHDASAAFKCAAAAKGFGELLKPGAVVLLGETHGTNESQQVVGQLACLAASRGLRVHLGLEIPRDEQPRLDAFLGSSDSGAAKQALLAGPFWTAPFQDGRSSEAMLRLLTQLRELIVAGANLEVFAFDTGTEGERDSGMAGAVLAALKHASADVALVLVGNAHARRVKGAPWNAGLVPMGWHLAQALPSLTSLNLEDAGGTAWVCVGAGPNPCNSRALQGPDRGTLRFVELSKPREGGYDGALYLGEVSASPPAVGTPRGCAAPKAANAELLRLFREDQADRQGSPDWSAVNARDAARRDRVRQIVDSGGAQVSADYLYAAVVFQHGADTLDFQRSHSLALKAVELDPTNQEARWLAAASKDRELMTLGRPQRYGTQSRKENGRSVRYPVDPTVTDAERLKWNVPPLREAKKR